MKINVHVYLHPDEATTATLQRIETKIDTLAADVRKVLTDNADTVAKLQAAASALDKAQADLTQAQQPT